METIVQAADRRINGDIAASMRGNIGTGRVAAWNRNRSENVQQLLDIVEFTPHPPFSRPVRSAPAERPF